MQTLILAAGESSRFWPFSEEKHKAFLKIGNRTIVEYVIDKLGDGEIILVVNPKRYIENSIKTRKNVKLVEQKEALGMDDAILRSKDVIHDDFLVIMPYYINIDSYLNKVKGVKAPAIALRKYEEGDEKTHGIVRVKGNKIIEIREKEKFEGATHSIIGMYKLNKAVVNKLDKMKDSKGGFEEILNEIAKKEGINYFEIEQLPSLKYVTDLLSIRESLYETLAVKTKNPTEGKGQFIDKTVVIGKNVKIGNNVSLKGKTFIGDNSFIGDNCLIRDSIINENVEIGFGTEIARSIIMDNTHIHSGFIGDSVIGENCKIGANFITANRRIDRKTIRIKVKNEDYDTGLTRLGVIMGNDVKTGISVSTMPGTLVGNNSIIGSNTEIKGKIASNKLVYNKTELMEKDI
jgi:bifunctional UDP-N-acetylglucosamine pyrophosphorylase/glucosamine-1-phosphate N-acetyltransferase